MVGIVKLKNVAVTDENGIVNQIPTTIWHYRLPSGIIAQGEWVSSTVVNADNSTSTVWYYIKPNTEMAVNEWIMSNGKSYYMTETGAMLVNAKAPDGSTVNDKGEKTK